VRKQGGDTRKTKEGKKGALFRARQKGSKTSAGLTVLSVVKVVGAARAVVSAEIGG